MEIKTLINPLLRWWWLILASTIVAMVASFFATLRQPPIYQSQTTLIIGRAINDPNPTSGEINLAEQLASTYADIANREPVRNATMQSLGLTSLPSYTAGALPNSQIIQIQVTDVNPVRAQAVADELAKQLIAQSPTAANPEDEARQQFINDQLNRLQSQIDQTQTEIEGLQEQLGKLTSARDIQDTQNQVTSLQTALTELRSSYNGLLSNTQQGAINTLAVIEPASLPRQPIGPNKPLTILLAGAIGFVLAASAAYLIEFMDDTLKTTKDITDIIDAPILGRIGDMPEDQPSWRYVTDAPRSPISDSFRSLRTNIDFMNVAKPHKIILVSSANIGEGKSTIASNLASIYAQSDRKVILVDCDLRRPTLHSWLDKTNPKGLSDIFRERITLWEAITPTNDKNISLITSGPLPPNPTELLASPKMTEILSDLRDIADLIIIDGPPFILPDASVLADKMDAVLLVIRPRQSRRTLVKGMYEQLKRIDTDVLGIVVNGASKTFGEYEPYYEAYTHNSPPTKSKGKRTGTDRSSLQKMFAALTKKQTPSE
jgi:succinoglycan biosynthesis transport protein ExoP